MISDLNAETVRKQDPDRFLLSMFAPAKTRPHLWALYAFNHEIARTREVVTDTHLGLIRLQWWRDMLKAYFEQGSVSTQPVAAGLVAAIREHRLPRDLFDEMVYAREFDLEDKIPVNALGTENYAAFTHTPLLQLSLMCLGQDMDDIDYIRHIATGYAMTGLIRAFPHHLRQRRCYFPAELLPPAEILFDAKEEDRSKIIEATKHMAHMAENHLAAGMRGDKNVSSYADLHVHLARMYLAQIKRAGFDPFSPLLQVPPFFREGRLMWKSFFA